ncbi:hypothetical protein AVA63_004949, partial [Salmonella enterica subsp. enterica]|nr:hypothetical protein [Salmonella enterica subsp. enterica]EDV7019676.1 hypothetical protein [Salmonella enterica subsp. enterica]
KTLGGLKASYYIRHFIFGAIISTFFIYISMQNPSGMKVGNVIKYDSGSINNGTGRGGYGYGYGYSYTEGVLILAKEKGAY